MGIGLGGCRNFNRDLGRQNKNAVAEANGAEKSDGSSRVWVSWAAAPEEWGQSVFWVWETGEGGKGDSFLPVEQPTRDGMARDGCWTSQGLSPDPKK